MLDTKCTISSKYTNIRNDRNLKKTGYCLVTKYLEKCFCLNVKLLKYDN